MRERRSPHTHIEPSAARLNNPLPADPANRSTGVSPAARLSAPAITTSLNYCAAPRRRTGWQQQNLGTEICALIKFEEFNPYTDIVAWGHLMAAQGE